MLDLLFEELHFAHPTGRPPLNVGRIFAYWDCDENMFVVDCEVDEDNIFMLSVIDMEEYEVALAQWMMRLTLIDLLFAQVADNLMRQVLRNGPMSSDELHEWSFHCLVDTVNSVPRDALMNTKFTLLSVDEDNRQLAFG